MTIGVRDDETISYNIVYFMPIGMTTAVVLASWLGIASFLVYNYMVGCQYYQNKSKTFYFIQFHPWSILVSHKEDTTTYREEDTEYADIYIPVPYDPKIPGVRCVDAEELENEIVAMVNTPNDDGGEDIELQDLGQGDDLGDVGALDPSMNLQTGGIEDMGKWGCWALNSSWTLIDIKEDNHM